MQSKGSWLLCPSSSQGMHNQAWGFQGGDLMTGFSPIITGSPDPWSGPPQLTDASLPCCSFLRISFLTKHVSHRNSGGVETQTQVSSPAQKGQFLTRKVIALISRPGTAWGGGKFWDRNQGTPSPWAHGHQRLSRSWLLSSCSPLCSLELSLPAKFPEHSLLFSKYYPGSNSR